MAHVWDIFTDVFDPNGYGFGPCLLKFEEMLAYSQITGTLILPLEARVMRHLSELFVKTNAKKENPNQLQNVTSMKDSSGLKSLFARTGTQKRKKPARSKTG